MKRHLTLKQSLQYEYLLMSRNITKNTTGVKGGDDSFDKHGGALSLQHDTGLPPFCATCPSSGDCNEVGQNPQHVYSCLFPPESITRRLWFIKNLICFMACKSGVLNDILHKSTKASVGLSNQSHHLA